MSDLKQIIDYSTLEPRDDAERKFIEIFKQSSTVIYDWGGGVTWVIDGDIEEDGEDPEKQHGMDDYRFLEELAGVDFISSADVVVALLCNGKNVEIRNRTTPLSADFINHYRETAKEVTGNESPQVILRQPKNADD